MTEGKVRIDKWLWAARFFKTRALASEAVSGGKVHLDGQRIKPSRSVRIGDCYEIRRGFDRLVVVVEQLADRRGSASLAQTLYHETEQSQQRRAREAEQRKLAQMQRPQVGQRPNKQQRRKMRDLTGKY